MPREEVKKLPSDITTYCQYSSNRGSAMTYFKKDDLAKGNTFSVPDLSSLKGSDPKMSEAVTYTQEQVDALTKEAVDKAVKEALANLPEPLAAPESYMTKEQVAEKLGKELPADKVAYLRRYGTNGSMVEDAVAMGVRAQGNASG